MMWSDPYMAQLVAIQRRNDAMEKERKERLIRETASPEPSQNLRHLCHSLLSTLSAAVAAPAWRKRRLQGEREG